MKILSCFCFVGFASVHRRVLILFIEHHVCSPVVWTFLGKISNFHSPDDTPRTGEKYSSPGEAVRVSQGYVIGAWISSAR